MLQPAKAQAPLTACVVATSQDSAVFIPGMLAHSDFDHAVHRIHVEIVFGSRSHSQGPRGSPCQQDGNSSFEVHDGDSIF